mmetsp:Transcript_158347/g.507857  ORF Transcript_158347/g.507857 Transcript_158347/m.507857 type:complete len:154 (+) Transcript_158347:353-814(+)
MWESCCCQCFLVEIFNVGGDKPYTINELGDAISKAAGSPDHPRDLQPARMEVEVAVSNHDKVKAFFKHPPTILLDEGLERTVSWYKSKGKFFRPVEFASVEVLERMPPSWVRPDLRETAVCEGSRVATDLGAVAGSAAEVGGAGATASAGGEL